MFTYDQTLSALHDVVDADPNRRNDACVYFEYDEPVCVVGQVVARLDLTDLRDWLVDHAAGSLLAAWDSDLVDEYQRTRLEFEEHFTPPAVDLLACVQRQADAHHTWGNALERGQREVMEQLLAEAERGSLTDDVIAING